MDVLLGSGKSNIYVFLTAFLVKKTLAISKSFSIQPSARLIVRNLLSDPAWRPDELGEPLPNDRHAVSVCLPTWESVIGYEEGRDKVLHKLKCGYPRFFKHPAIERLFAECSAAVTNDTERAVVFPDKEAAQRAHRFVEKRTGVAVRVHSYEGLQAVVAPVDIYPVLMEYWRYTGEVVSSRQAVNILEGNEHPEHNSQLLREYIAGLGSYGADDVFLYQSGMAAIFNIHRVGSRLSPGKKTLQLDFPYVDALKVQNHFAAGAVMLNETQGEPFEEALQRIRQGEFSVVFCELPSNPLLHTVDMVRVSEACRDGDVLLAVDDTVASVYNVDVSEYADVVSSSLTKWISGVGDVMAGAVQLNEKSSFYNDLKGFFLEDSPRGSKLYAADEEALLKNAQGFEARIQKANVNGELLAGYLKEHPAVDHVWYPKFTDKERYDVLRREKGGYGGLLSFTLKQPKRAPKVFDSLELCKGPSLGTEFTLVSPYTLLAHYDELEWAEDCGVESHLIRVSAGIEDSQILVDAFGKALEA